MGFFKNLITGFTEAAKAGGEFNPVLATVMSEIEDLHRKGHLDQVVYDAEQAYEKEHAEYKAKGIHTDAADSQRESAELKHFMNALKAKVDTIDPSAQDDVKKLLELQSKMENILGNAFKK